MSRITSVVSKLQELDRLNFAKKSTISFKELFKQLFSPSEYSSIPHAIEEWGNVVMAYQVLFYVGKMLGKNICINLYKIASTDSRVKKMMDARSFDKLILDDNWYQQNNYLTESKLIIHFEREFDSQTRNKLLEIVKQDPFTHDKLKRYGY